MAKICTASPGNILSAAERELGAFLLAVENRADLGDTTRVAEIWIEAFESQDWPDNNFDTFFRKVTIRAACDLARDVRTAEEAIFMNESVETAAREHKIVRTGENPLVLGTVD